MSDRLSKASPRPNKTGTINRRAAVVESFIGAASSHHKTNVRTVYPYDDNGKRLTIRDGDHPPAALHAACPERNRELQPPLRVFASLVSPTGLYCILPNPFP